MREKVWRYRGVLLVLAAPAFLLLAILALAPASRAPARYSSTLHDAAAAVPHHRTPDLHRKEAAGGGGSSNAGSSNADFIYQIVMDAGSTGSRIHCFKFEKRPASAGGLRLISDTFQQLKPGLSAYPDDPEKAAASLEPLINRALQTVPAEMQSSTSILLSATAGLRLLPGNKADNILAAVRSYLASKTPFRVSPGAVSILDGKDEGAFAWMTLNYLLGHIGGEAGSTVAAIDLGGGSVQEAFALSDADAASAPANYVVPLRAAGRKYNVYVHSYLGYGLMAARAKVIAADADPSDGHPCFKGFTGSYTYGGKQFDVKDTVEIAEFKTCAAMAARALGGEAECGAPSEQCAFSGAWRGLPPSGMARVYYVSSYFWDRASDTGIIEHAEAIEWKTSPAEFAKHAEKACGRELDDITSLYPRIQSDQAPYICLDLSFCHTILTKGFKLPEEAPVTLVKRVMYNGQAVEAAWPLGAAIAALGSAGH